MSPTSVCFLVFGCCSVQSWLCVYKGWDRCSCTESLRAWFRGHIPGGFPVQVETHTPLLLMAASLN